MSSISFSLSRRRSTTFSPKSVGSVETRKSSSRERPSTLELDLDATVLRQALLRDVELRHDLDARDERVAQAERRVHHVVEHAVDAEADAHLLLVRLDVNVGRAALEGVDQEDVDETHDGRVLAHARQIREVDLVVVVNDFDVSRRASASKSNWSSDIESASGEAVAVEVRCRSTVSVLEPARQLDLARLRVISARWPPARSLPRRRPARCSSPVMNLMSSMAKTFVGSTIASVSVAPTRESGSTEYLSRHLARDEPYDRVVDVEQIKIDRRDAVLPREHGRYHVVGDEPQLDEVEAQTARRARADSRALRAMLRGQEVFADENFAEFG